MPNEIVPYQYQITAPRGSTTRHLAQSQGAMGLQAEAALAALEALAEIHLAAEAIVADALNAAEEIRRQAGVAGQTPQTHLAADYRSALFVQQINDLLGDGGTRLREVLARVPLAIDDRSLGDILAEAITRRLEG